MKRSWGYSGASARTAPLQLSQPPQPAALRAPFAPRRGWLAEVAQDQLAAAARGLGVLGHLREARFGVAAALRDRARVDRRTGVERGEPQLALGEQPGGAERLHGQRPAVPPGGVLELRGRERALRVQLLDRDELRPAATHDLVVGVRLVDEAALQRVVATRVEQRALGRLAVAPGASRLLVVGLEAAGHLQVDDITYIGLVDAEAERVGGDDQWRAAGGEAALDGRARGAAHARVVALGGYPGGIERFGGFLHGAARAGVDDAGLAAAFARVGDQPGEPLPGAGDRRHLEAQVRAVEAGQHLAGLGGDAEPGEDVTPHGRVGGRRERERARPAELLARAAEREVVGAEVVPPLRDAVRLVDHEQAHTAAREAIEEAPVREPLRCDEEQRDASRLEVGVAAVLLGAIERGVDEGRRDSDRLEGLDLVLHQRDQRRDHERAADLERGQHVAEALAAAGRHHPEHVVRRERLEHLGLAGSEIGVAEAVLQQLAVAHGVARQVGHRRARRDGGRGAAWGCLGQRVGRERQGRLRLRGRVWERVRVGGRDGRSLLDWRRLLGQRTARGAEGPIGRPRRIAVKAAHGRILAENARSRTCECAFAA